MNATIEGEKILEAEKMVLGSILMGGSEVLAPLIPVLGGTGECFYNTSHRAIYESAIKLFNDSDPIDAMSAAMLVQKDYPGMVPTIADAVAKTTYILESTPTIETAMYYAELTKQYSRRRRLKSLGAEIQRRSDDETIEVDNLISKFSQNIIAINDTASKDFQLANELDELEKDMEIRMSGADLTDRVFSGFPELDKISGGFVNGELTIIAGMTSAGKSSLTMAIVLYLLQKNIPVIIFLLEMSQSQLLYRMIASRTGIPYTTQVLGDMTKAEFEQWQHAKEELSQKPLYICPGRSSVQQMTLLTQQQIHRWQRKCVVVIDYLQLIRASSKGSLYETTTANITDIKTEIATNLDLPTIVVSQVSRKNQYSSNKRVDIFDLRDSGAIEANAGLILILQKPSSEDGAFFKDIKDKQLVEVDVAKGRLSGTGTLSLNFEPEILRFSEC
jgi:replicative DNA helicase